MLRERPILKAAWLTLLVTSTFTTLWEATTNKASIECEKYHLTNAIAPRTWNHIDQKNIYVCTDEDEGYVSSNGEIYEVPGRIISTSYFLGPNTNAEYLIVIYSANQSTPDSNGYYCGIEYFCRIRVFKNEIPFMDLPTVVHYESPYA